MRTNGEHTLSAAVVSSSAEEPFLFVCFPRCPLNVLLYKWQNVENGGIACMRTIGEHDWF